MADPTEPDAQGAPPNSPEAESYARQWFRLCRLLDVDSAEAALRRVRTLLEEATADSRAPQKGDGLVPIDDVEAVLEEMNAELEHLKTRNAQLQQRLDSADDSAAPAQPPAADPASQDLRALLDLMNADSVEDAAAFLDDVTDTLDRFEAKRDQLRSERDQLRQERDQLQLDRKRLAEKYEALRSQHQDLQDELAAVEAELPPDPVLDVAVTLRDAFGIDSMEEARTLGRRIQKMHDRLQALQEERAALADTVGVDDVSDIPPLVESMNEQLVELYDAQRAEATARASASEKLDAIRDILGVGSAAEARALTDTVQALVNELETLRTASEKAEALGLSGLEEAVGMIESMDAQLNDLYRRHERMAEAIPAQPLDADLDLVDQLQVLFAEQERMEAELGVSSAEAVIDMVDSLTAQLERFYAERDAEASPSDASPEGTSADGPTAQMLTSMQHQLEALYEEKELLAEHDVGDAREAIDRIQSLRERTETLDRRIHQLQADNDRYAQAVRDVRRALDADDLSELAGTVRTLRNEVNRLSDAVSERGAPTPSPDTDWAVNTAPPVVDEHTLTALETASGDDLHALSVGVVRLAADGTIRFVNEAAVPIPGIRRAETRDALVGANFFDLAPGTERHPAFRQFRAGLPDRPMNARFPYLLPSEVGAPTVLLIHLHRKPDSASSWILFRSL